MTGDLLKMDDEPAEPPTTSVSTEPPGTTPPATTTATTTTTTTTQQPTRVTTTGETCLPCRISKVRCDKQVPCGRCRRRKMNCIPQTKGKRRHRRRQFAQAMSYLTDGKYGLEGGQMGYVAHHWGGMEQPPPPPPQGAADLRARLYPMPHPGHPPVVGYQQAAASRYFPHPAYGQHPAQDPYRRGVPGGNGGHYPVLYPMPPWAEQAGREEWAAARAAAERQGVPPPPPPNAGGYPQQQQQQQPSYGDYWRARGHPAMGGPPAMYGMHPPGVPGGGGGYGMPRSGSSPRTTSPRMLPPDQQPRKEQLARDNSKGVQAQPTTGPLHNPKMMTLTKHDDPSNSSSSLAPSTEEASAHAAANEAAENLLRVKEVVSTVSATFGAFEKAAAVVDDDTKDLPEDDDDDDDDESDEFREETDVEDNDEGGPPASKRIKTTTEEALPAPVEKKTKASDPQAEAHEDSPAASACDIDPRLDGVRTKLEAAFDEARRLSVETTTNDDPTTVGATAILSAWLHRRKTSPSNDWRRVLGFLAEVAVNQDPRPNIVLLKRILDTVTEVDNSSDPWTDFQAFLLRRSDTTTRDGSEEQQKKSPRPFADGGTSGGTGGEKETLWRFPPWQHGLDTHVCPVLYMTTNRGRLEECDANDVFNANFVDNIKDTDGVFDLFRYVVHPDDLIPLAMSLVDLLDPDLDNGPSPLETCVVARFNPNVAHNDGWMAKRQKAQPPPSQAQVKLRCAMNTAGTVVHYGMCLIPATYELTKSLLVKRSRTE